MTRHKTPPHKNPRNIHSCDESLHRKHLHCLPQLRSIHPKALHGSSHPPRRQTQPWLVEIEQRLPTGACGDSRDRCPPSTPRRRKAPATAVAPSPPPAQPASCLTTPRPRASPAAQQDHAAAGHAGWGGGHQEDESARGESQRKRQEPPRALHSELLFSTKSEA